MRKGGIHRESCFLASRHNPIDLCVLDLCGLSTATANIEFRALVNQVSAKVAEEAKIAANGRKIERALPKPSSFNSLEMVGLTYHRINLLL